MENKDNEELITRFFKKADSAVNKIIIPKTFVKEHGYEFYMDIYKDKIVLIPVKKKEEQ